MANTNDANDLGILFAGIGPRQNADGTRTIYCKNCSRPIMRMVRPTVTSVSKCALCILREQGVEHPEQHVLASYVITDPMSPPIPLEQEDPVNILYPEEAVAQGKIPASGGVVGTTKAFFRAVVGWFGQEERPQSVPLSKKITRQARSGGLYERK